MRVRSIGRTPRIFLQGLSRPRAFALRAHFSQIGGQDFLVASNISEQLGDCDAAGYRPRLQQLGGLHIDFNRANLDVHVHSIVSARSIVEEAGEITRTAATKAASIPAEPGEASAAIDEQRVDERVRPFRNDVRRHRSNGFQSGTVLRSRDQQRVACRNRNDDVALHLDLTTRPVSSTSNRLGS